MITVQGISSPDKSGIEEDHNDTRSPTEEADLSRLKDTFRLVLDLLYPDNDDPSVLLEFLNDREVDRIDQLGRFDTHHVIWDATLGEVMRRETALDLGKLCEYIAHFGGDAFLRLMEDSAQRKVWSCPICGGYNEFVREVTICTSIECQARNGHNVVACQINYMGQGLPARTVMSKEKQRAKAIFNEMRLALAQESRKKEDLCKARIKLKKLMKGEDFWDFMLDSKKRKQWLDEGGALQLLEQYPVMAWEDFEGKCGFQIYKPIFFFLFAGFEMEVLQQVIRHNPKATSKGDYKHVVDQFLDEACRERPRGIAGSFQVVPTVAVPLEIIQRMLEFMPDLARKRDKVDKLLLLERLFYMGFSAQVLEHVRTCMDDTVDDLILKRHYPPSLNLHHQDWAMDAKRADVVLKMVPQLKNLRCESKWFADGWIHFLDCLTDCARPKLETLTLSLPASVVHPNSRAKASLKRLFGRMEAPRLKEIVWPRGDRGHQILFDQYASCLGEIASGLASTTNIYKQLTLKDCDLSEEGAIALLANDVIERLDVQFGRLLYQCPWDLNGTHSKGVRLLKLALHGFNAVSFEGWNKLWERASKLSRLEKVMYLPGHADNQHGWITVPLHYIAQMPRLKTLCLFAHTSETTVDITKPLVTLLEHGTLEFLQIEGSHEDEEGNIGCLAYGIDVNDLCQSLKDNKSLQFLFLRGIELKGTNTSKSFLQVLQEEGHNNTTLEFMDICDDRHFYTVIPKDSWRRDVHHGFTYESYPEAWQIYYLTSFNRFGRGKIRDKSTTPEEFVHLLADVHALVDMNPEEASFYRDILHLLSSGDDNRTAWDDGDPLGKLNELYGLLRGSPRKWYNGVKRQIEEASLKYGLLRESPGLWCANVLKREFGVPTKRRRLE